MKEQQLAQSNIDDVVVDDGDDEDNSDEDDDYAIDNDDSDVDTDDDVKTSIDLIIDDIEIQKNAKITEKAFLTGEIVVERSESIVDTTLSRNPSFELQRQVILEAYNNLLLLY